MMSTRSFVAAFVAALAFAACGDDRTGSSDPATPSPTDTPVVMTPMPSDDVTPEPTMEPVTDFRVTLEDACQADCDATFNWTCGEDATWGVFAELDSGVIRLTETEATSATVTLDDRFKGKVATFWSQRLGADMEPIGPRSNEETVGPIMPSPDFSWLNGMYKCTSSGVPGDPPFDESCAVEDNRLNCTRAIYGVSLDPPDPNLTLFPNEGFDWVNRFDTHFECRLQH